MPLNIFLGKSCADKIQKYGTVKKGKEVFFKSHRYIFKQQCVQFKGLEWFVRNLIILKII